MSNVAYGSVPTAQPSPPRSRRLTYVAIGIIGLMVVGGGFFACMKLFRRPESAIRTTSSTNKPGNEGTIKSSPDSTTRPSTIGTEKRAIPRTTTPVAPSVTTNATPLPTKATSNSAPASPVNIPLAGSLGGHPCDDSLRGKTVTIESALRGADAQKAVSVWGAFERCTGVTIRYTGSSSFDADIVASVGNGSQPDLAIVQEPALLARLVQTGRVVERNDLRATVTEASGSGLLQYGTVSGTFYAPPFDASLKSIVWYNPQAFAASGYTVPSTWDELVALSNKIVADGRTPWCAGIESGLATGWPVTDFLEDVVLSNDGPDVYDQWVSNAVKFNDPRIQRDLDLVGNILKSDGFVNGGGTAIAATRFSEAGLGIPNKSCYMFHMASFYGTLFPKGTQLGLNGTASVFPFPTISPANKGVTEVFSDLVVALRDAPEVRAVQDFSTSVDFANERAALGGFLTVNRRVDTSNYADPVERVFAEQLKAATSFRFDGTDLMPAVVGAGSSWKELTKWIQGQDAKTTVDNIQNSWP
jgi:alpha-glucoside transport system substrate-binding protein